MKVKDNERYDNKPNLSVYKLLDRRGRGFSMMDNSIPNNDHKLSTDELAIYLYMISKDETTWHLDIATMNRKLRITAYRSQKARAELVKKGFLVQKEIRKNGRKAYEYTIYELPKEELMRLNQRTENNVQETDGEKLTLENITHNNTNSKNNINNNIKLKVNNHICKTESFARGINLLVNSSKEDNTACNNEHVSHESISKPNNIGKLEQNSNEKNAEVTINSASKQLHELNEDIKKAEEKLESIELRNKRRIRNEKEVHGYIDTLEDISDEIKQLLKDYVSSWKDKGRKVTVIELNTLLEELSDKCKTEAEKINSIKTALSCGYKRFFPVNKKNSTGKSSNTPQFQFYDEAESN